MSDQPGSISAVPDEAALREAIVATCQQFGPSGLSEGSSGNIGVRLADGFLVTPSGVDYAALRPGDIVHMGMDGRCDHALVPSSEWRFHRDILAARPEVGAVVHAHPTHCVALAVRRVGIPAFHYMVAVAGGNDIRCAPYATYGTEALSANALDALRGRRACLLANHGMIATGASLAQAFALAREVEGLARQYILALTLGGPVLLDDAEMDRVLEKFKSYGANAQAAAHAMTRAASS